MTPQIPNATPKGSLVIVRRQHSYNSLIMGAYAGYVRFEPAIVESASRDGRAKRIASKNGTVRAVTVQDEVMAIPAARMANALPENVLRALDESYDELAEVRSALLAVLASSLEG